MLAFSPDVKRILCHYFKEKTSKIYHQVDVSLKNLISTFVAESQSVLIEKPQISCGHIAELIL